MMEYLQLSGTKCLDFQANNKKNRKSKTPVLFPNSPLPPGSQPPPPPFKITSQFQQKIVYRIQCLYFPPTTPRHYSLWYWTPQMGELVAGSVSAHPFRMLWRPQQQQVCLIFFLGRAGLIVSWILWVHGEFFKDSEMCIIINHRFSCCLCLCETPFPRKIVLIPKKCKYEEVCFKGCTIRFWEQFLISTEVRGTKKYIVTSNIWIIYWP